MPKPLRKTKPQNPMKTPKAKGKRTPRQVKRVVQRVRPKRYQVIYADPPWDQLGWNKNKNGWHCPANHYEVMSDRDIRNLPVQQIAAPTCALFLWVTFPGLELGLDVLRSWGFKYATVAFTWIKRNPVSRSFFYGLGNYTRANAEICLLGTKGECQKMRKSTDVRQIVDTERLRHSEKPHEVRDRITELFGDVPRIELFARHKVPGWDVWGDEVPSDMEFQL